ALPIWMEFMAKALRNLPQRSFTVPAGVITAQVNAQTGAPVADGEAGGISEYFYQEYAPSQGLSIPAESDHNPLAPDLI
ncbi:MAG: hypothetical protein WBP86_09835, partial [Thiobacillaceae bacterium]